MVSVVRMPAALAGVTEAAIQTWAVRQGEPVAVGDLLAEIETEKAVVEYVAEVGGVLARHLVAEGSTAEVGQPIAVILEDGEGEDAIATALAEAGAATTAVAPDDAPAAPAAAAPASASAPADAVPAVADAQDRPWRFASPLVRRRAREEGIDLASLTGTGPGGRIVRRDLTRALSSPSTAPAPATVGSPAAPAAGVPALSDARAGAERVPLTPMRSAIARRLAESKSSVPHFYLSAHCRVDRLLALRREVNEAGTHKVSVNDFVLKAVAGALRDVPQANVTWGGDHVLRHHDVDVAVAVAVDDGLLTPVVRDADRLPLVALSQQVSELAGRARAGRLRQHELEGGAFSVSNLGMFGVPEFAAILNPPQSGILAVGAAVPQPVAVERRVEVASVMTVTLSADHRAVDGAVAALWMQAFVRRVENPVQLLL